MRTCFVGMCTGLLTCRGNLGYIGNAPGLQRVLPGQKRSKDRPKAGRQDATTIFPHGGGGTFLKKIVQAGRLLCAYSLGMDIDIFLGSVCSNLIHPAFGGSGWIEGRVTTNTPTA